MVDLLLEGGVSRGLVPEIVKKVVGMLGGDFESKFNLGYLLRQDLNTLLGPHAKSLLFFDLSYATRVFVDFQALAQSLC